MYVTLKDGRRLLMPSDEEDAAITAAALSDPDNPPLTDEELAQMRPAREVLSPELYAALTDKAHPVKFVPVTATEDAGKQKRMGRPPLETPKEQINIRLSAQVLAAFRATGKGWQTRIDELLKEAVAAGRV